jgi:phosphoglycerate dehydrogenase-like enzyme
MHRVAVLDDYMNAVAGAADWGLLRGSAETDFFHDHLVDEDALVDRLVNYDIIVGERERTKFPRSLLERLPNLKLLILTGPVNWSIDFAAARELGIVVCGTEALQDKTPEITWGLILSLCRRVTPEDRAIRAGKWQTGLGVGLNGRVLGVIGLGQVGAAVARIGMAFQMEVIAWSENLTKERATEVGAELVSKDELLRRSDVVTLHVVLGERTKNLIQERDFALMKPTAYMVNTSRGPIVDESALLLALNNGTIAGAGLDVFDVEPLPADHPFRHMENLVITPHIGYITAEQFQLFYSQAVENIQAFLRREPIRILEAAS